MIDYRELICAIVSDMLDNPNEYGIYPTTKCYDELERHFNALHARCQELEKQNKALRENNDWLRQLLRCAKTFTVSGNPHEFNEKCDCVFCDWYKHVQEALKGGK